jgi:aspartate ammonia-lyase
MGRTQMQDAVPMTLGQEFAAFGHTLLEDVDRLGESLTLVREINMGATAIGTGITAAAGYTEQVRKRLSEVTGLELVTSPDLIEATSDTGAFVQLSGVLKRSAVKLSKICNDLRLLSSGPRAGFGRSTCRLCSRVLRSCPEGESGHSGSDEPGLLRRHWW